MAGKNTWTKHQSSPDWDVALEAGRVCLAVIHSLRWQIWCNLHSHNMEFYNSIKHIVDIYWIQLSDNQIIILNINEIRKNLLEMLTYYEQYETSGTLWFQIIRKIPKWNIENKILRIQFVPGLKYSNTNMKNINRRKIIKWNIENKTVEIHLLPSWKC